MKISSQLPGQGSGSNRVFFKNPSTDKPAESKPPGQGDGPDPDEPKQDLRQDLVQAGFGGSVLSTIGAAYPSTWLHEQGHAQAIKLLYQGAEPTVEVNPFKGGVTRWYPGPLTDLGEKLGSNRSRALVSAAGTLVDMAVAATSFGVGYQLKDEHPLVGNALMGFAGFTVLNSIGYAATALGKEGFQELARQGNDFASLALRTGLHPIAAIGIMAAMLPIEYMVLRALDDK